MSTNKTNVSREIFNALHPVKETSGFINALKNTAPEVLWPFFGRILMASNWLADTFIMKELDNNQLASGALIATLVYVGLGTLRVSVAVGTGASIAKVRGNEIKESECVLNYVLDCCVYIYLKNINAMDHEVLHNYMKKAFGKDSPVSDTKHIVDSWLLKRVGRDDKSSAIFLEKMDRLFLNRNVLKITSSSPVINQDLAAAVSEHLNELFNSDTALDLASMHNQIARGREKIRSLVWKGWLYGAVGSIPLFLIFSNIETILLNASIITVKPEIARGVQHYFNGLRWGFPFLMFLSADEYAAFALGHPSIPAVTDTLRVLVTMFTAYPLALTDMQNGLFWLGAGMTAGIISGFLGLRLYLFCKRDKYRGYINWQLPGINFFKELITGFGLLSRHENNRFLFLRTETWELLKWAFISGFQSLSDWSSLFALAAMCSNSVNSSDAVQVSFAFLAPFTILLQAFTTPGSILLRQRYGHLLYVAEQNGLQSKSVTQWRSDLRRVGYALFSISGLFSVVYGSALVGFNSYIPRLFLSTNDESYPLAKRLLVLNGIGAVLDGCRNMGVSNLKAISRVLLGPLISFILLVGCGVGGALFAFHKDDHAYETIFMIRNIALLLSALLITCSWEMIINFVSNARLFGSDLRIDKINVTTTTTLTEPTDNNNDTLPLLGNKSYIRG